MNHERKQALAGDLRSIREKSSGQRQLAEVQKRLEMLAPAGPANNSTHGKCVPLRLSAI